MDAARAGAASARIAISRSWISAARCGSGSRFQLRQQRRAFGVGGEHGIEQRPVPARRFLRDMAEARAGGEPDLAAVGLDLADDGLEQGGLARPVPPDQAEPAAGVEHHVRALQQGTAADAQREVADGEHRHGARLVARGARRRVGPGPGRWPWRRATGWTGTACRPRRPRASIPTTGNAARRFPCRAEDLRLSDLGRGMRSRMRWNSLLLARGARRSAGDRRHRCPGAGQSGDRCAVHGPAL